MAKVSTLQRLMKLADVELVEELPHEFLLRIMRGEEFSETTIDAYGNEIIRKFRPTLQMRMQAAKIAAPYLAPRLASSTVDVNGTLSVIGLATRLDEAQKRLA